METIPAMILNSLPKDRFDVGRYTKVVNFGQTPFLQDEEIADACVCVLSSDEKVGTLSHLMIFHDTRTFTQDLRDLVGKANVLYAYLVDGKVGQVVPN